MKPELLAEVTKVLETAQFEFITLSAYLREPHKRHVDMCAAQIRDVLKKIKVQSNA